MDEFGARAERVQWLLQMQRLAAAGPAYAQNVLSDPETRAELQAYHQRVSAFAHVRTHNNNNGGR